MGDEEKIWANDCRCSRGHSRGSCWKKRYNGSCIPLSCCSIAPQFSGSSLLLPIHAMIPPLVVFLAGETPYRGHGQRTSPRWDPQRVAALHPERCVAPLELVLLDETSLFEVYHRLDGRWQHQGEAQPFSAVRPTAGPRHRGEEERSLANKDSGTLQSVTDPKGTWKGVFW